ncbi:MAG: hypothetical protein IPG07_19125 [Crocinitomicaceae bacterium]|nr:hypothetical protein [Crocinitomicaceae bacterium]
MESYVTRHYQSITDVVKALIILVSFTIMILYYVIYPQFVAKRHPEKIELKEIPRYIQKRPIEWFKIRNVGETFTDTFYIFVQKISHLSRIFFGVIFPLALVLCAVIYLFEYKRFDYTDMTWYENMGTLFGTGTDFEFYKLFWLATLACIASWSSLFVNSR